MLLELMNQGLINPTDLILKYSVDLKLTLEEAICYSALCKSYIKNERGINTKKLVDVLHTSASKIEEMVESLLMKNCIATQMEVTKSGKTKEVFTIEPGLKAIEAILTGANIEEEQTFEEDFACKIEAFFGRVLSPRELETIASWTNVTMEQLQVAIYQAKSNHVKNIKYIDSILASMLEKEDKKIELENDKKEALGAFRNALKR